MSRRVAVLYQAIEPPVINGVKKPMKPGGYRDSGADIAHVLRRAGIPVITPASNPDPIADNDWCFPDTENGIVEAVCKGATHLWANTILFASHPLQISQKLSTLASDLKVVGQPPSLVEQYDDKHFVNDLLRKDGSFDLPKSWLVLSLDDPVLREIPYPIGAKPIRGRGSHGVKLCRNKEVLERRLEGSLAGSSPVMLEEYLAGQEGTVTVMPPSSPNAQYSALPIVVRFNHAEGIAPYNGIVAVTVNSRIPSKEERDSNEEFANVENACIRVAAKLRVTAPIRIDVRQFAADEGSKYALFDVNMKPNMTGPGRPGREKQASLTAMAAMAIGWSYPRLLQEILTSAQTLEWLRAR